VKTRAEVFSRDGYAWVKCGRAKQHGVVLEVHHKNPVSLGGGDELENLETTCEECNRGMSNNYPKKQLDSG